MIKDLVSIDALTLKDIEEIFILTKAVKKNRVKFNNILKGKTLALIFQKPSCRTRVSFEVGMYELGGNSIYLGPDEINLGVRESIRDVARTLSRYISAIVLRTFEHKNVLEMAAYSDKPVINGLSDLAHPCQALSDIYTIKERFANLKGITLAYVGDGNNVCNSLLCACAKTGINMNVAAPKGYEPASQVIRQAKIDATSNNAAINLFDSSQEAVKGADVIYTDVWASMGQEREIEERGKIFAGFQVNSGLVKLAKKGALIMHCLPAHRGQEITDEIIDSRNSIVFLQAENRLHVQKAILIKLLGSKK